MFNWFKERRRRKDMAQMLAAELINLCETLKMTRGEIVEMLVINQGVLEEFDWDGPEEGRRKRYFEFLVEQNLVPVKRLELLRANPDIEAQLQTWFEQPSLIQL